MINELLSIIKMLNGGSVIQNSNDKDTVANIDSESTFLFIGNGDKYYYFSEYWYKDGQSNLSDIEKDILYNQNIELKAQHSYLILFYQVDEINEYVYKRVIEIEESEYFYKKYVFYFTEAEYVAFKEWYENKSGTTANDLVNNGYIHDNAISLEMQFLLRLLIKVPIIKYRFKRAELKDFNDILTNKISRMRSITMGKTVELNEEITRVLLDNENDIEKSVNYFYKENVGE